MSKSEAGAGIRGAAAHAPGAALHPVRLARGS